MKKVRLKSLIAAVLVAALIFAAPGCTDSRSTKAKQLGTPELSFDEVSSTVSWTEVGGAEKYAVSVNGQVSELNALSIKLDDGSFEEPDDRVFEVTVTAKAKGYFDSEAGQIRAVLWQKLEAPTGFMYEPESSSFVWNASEGAEYYETVINGAVKAFELPRFSILGDSIEISANDSYTLRVTAKAASKRDSETAEYTSTARPVKLDEPSGLRMDGYIVKWNPVTYAKTYKVVTPVETRTVQKPEYDLFGYTNSVILRLSAHAYGCYDSGEVGYNAVLPALPALSQPSGLKVETGILSWNAVANAESYTVNVNGTEIGGITGTTLAIDGNAEIPAAQSYNIKVKAKAEGYNDSAYSAEYTYTPGGTPSDKLTAPTGLTIESGIIGFTGTDGAESYVLKINGTEYSGITETSVDLNYDARIAYPENHNYTVSVKACAAGKADSEYTADVNYSAAGKPYAVPKDVRLSGNSLVFTAPVGAKAFRFTDIDRNVFTVSGTSYTLTGKLMIISVEAVSLGEDRTASASAEDITYLEGEGTAASPYLIGNIEALRSIDYYESEFAAKLYYRITQNISAGSFSPMRSLSGVLDGGGKTISGVNVTVRNGHFALFDSIYAGAEVKNLTVSDFRVTLENPDMSVAGKLAAIAITNYGTISGITLTGLTFRADSTIAGIAVYNRSGGVIENCSIDASTLTVTGTGQDVIGGICAVNQGAVKTCTASSSVTLRGKGVAGTSSGTSGGIVAVGTAGVGCTDNASVTG